MAPCAASANISVGLFRSLRQLSYNSSITSRRPIPFWAVGHTSYKTNRHWPRSDLSIQRRFCTSAPIYNSASSQTSVPESANTATAGSEKSSAEDGIAQRGASSSDDKGWSNTDPRDGSSPEGRRVKPRRHRKDKPLIRYHQLVVPEKEPLKEGWRAHKEAMKRKFKDGWNPRKKLSPDDMERVRHLHAQDPVQFSTPALAQQFKVSPEAIRRILKSKWRPSEEQMAKRRENWEKRHNKIWTQMSELGLRPKRKSLSPYADAAVQETKAKDEP